MSKLTDFVNALSPPPVNVPNQYDGWQFRWKFMVFRPALFKNELYLILGILFYVAFFWWGSSINANKAKKWVSKHLPIYDQQFSQPNPKGLTTDGHTDFFVFSTGRRNIKSLHTIFRLRPRHDLLQYILQTAWKLIDLQYRPVDELQLDFTLAPGAVQDSFVFAVVAKDELSSVKGGRWDLTFAKTSENPALPATLSVMSEYADITENILVKLPGNINLAAALQDPKILPYFRSFSITDQPRERPTSPIRTDEREKHVILTLRLPDPSEAEHTIPLINSTFHLIDSLHKLSLRPETKAKLRKTREEFDKVLKEESEREKKEEEEEAKAAKKKKAEEERISKLSAAEQRKEREREKKRMIRKSQKVVRK